jgi:hypothetical protein
MADQKLQRLHQDISYHLEQIAKLFKRDEGVKLTIVVRMPKREDGGVLLSDDDFDLAIAEIQRLRAQGELTGTKEGTSR